MGQTRLILASASPRRRELLSQVGVEFRVEPAHVDEAVRPGEAPRDYVLRVATEKAEKIAAATDGLVLAADTSVVLGSEILGKPESGEHAIRMLRSLAGKTHRVITAVCVTRGIPDRGGDRNSAGPSTPPSTPASGLRSGYAQGERDSVVVETEVEMRTASEAELEWYVATGEPMDKAGGYAIQGAGGFLVRAIRGSYSCVVGLPLAETIALLERAGLPLPWRRR